MLTAENTSEAQPAAERLRNAFWGVLVTTVTLNDSVPSDSKVTVFSYHGPDRHIGSRPQGLDLGCCPGLGWGSEDICVPQRPGDSEDTCSLQGSEDREDACAPQHLEDEVLLSWALWCRGLHPPP